LPSSKTHPIVLAHGIARIDVLLNRTFGTDNRDEADEWHYFKNIRTHLKAHGFEVHHAWVPWARSVADRSYYLKQKVDEVLDEPGVEKVHIIAHSMGGLDARRMMFDNRAKGYHKKIATLTTIATPHHGSAFADLVSRAIPWRFMFLQEVFGGIKDLTRRSTAKFNAQAATFEDQCGVRFRTYAGSQEFIHIVGPLKFSWKVINLFEGANDGFVSERSAKWNEDHFIPPVHNADHLNLMGWWDPSETIGGKDRDQLEDDTKRLYLEIARELALSCPAAVMGR
jgi:triacylglycerol lipase